MWIDWKECLQGACAGLVGFSDLRMLTIMMIIESLWEIMCYIGGGGAGFIYTSPLLYFPLV